VSLGWVLATGALAGLIKAVTTPVVESWFGLPDVPLTALIVRGVGAVIVGVWLITIVAYALTALERLDDARNALIRTNVAKRLAEDTLVGAPEVAQSIQAIEGVRESLAGSPHTVSARRIRDVVESTIRPLSHALWSVESSRYPSLKLVSLYRMALQSQKLRPGLIALVWSGTSFTGLAASAGIVDAAAYTASVGAVAMVLFTLVRLGWTQSIIGSVLAVVAASSVAVLGGFGLAGLLAPGTFEAVGIPLLVAGIAWMSFVTLGSSVLSAALNLRSVIDNDLANADTREFIEEQSGLGAKTLSSRRLATRLHGAIQSKLLGLAASIEQRGATPEDVDQSLADILEGLEGITEESAERSPRPAPTVQELVAGWEDILDVDVEVSSQVLLDEVFEAEPDTAEVLREALVNAYRHGAAQKVRIRATRDQDGVITLQVTDDGYGPRDGEPGLGSALLDRWSGSHWSLSPGSEGGAQLEARLGITPT
jgi:signal transduction histidine kinase